MGGISDKGWSHGTPKWEWGGEVGDKWDPKMSEVPIE